MQCCAGFWFRGAGVTARGLAQETERPSVTMAAAERRTAGGMKLSVPNSSSAPQRLQLLNRRL